MLSRASFDKHTHTMDLIRLLCLFHAVYVVFCSEPHCSKFHYEEQLLHKMVKIEFNMEKLAEQNSKAIEAIQAELDSLKAERKDVMDSVDRLKEEVKNGVKAGSNQVVAFSARTVKNPDPKKGESLVFTDVSTNVGNGYDNTTGVFTAPVDGIYLFHDQMCVIKGKDFYHAILVDNVGVSRERYEAMPESGAPVCFTAVVTRTLKTGQTVSVQCVNLNKVGPWLVDDKFRWNMFSGVLLR